MKRNKVKPTKKKILIGVGITFLLLLIFFGGRLITSKKSVNYNSQLNKPTVSVRPSPVNTEVIFYKQTDVPNKSKKGSCWTTSIAKVSDPNAFRCSVVGSYIYDPCLRTETGVVVCGAEPEEQANSFVLTLTESLPKEVPQYRTEDELSEANLAWVVELDNKMKCTGITGTASYEDGHYYYYACANKGLVVLGQINTNTDPWTGKLLYYKGNDYEVDKYEDVKILKVWR